MRELNPDYEAFRANFSTHDAKKVAWHLAEVIEDFAWQRFANEDRDTENELRQLFALVMHGTGERWSTDSIDGHEQLVHRWRNNRSKELALATFYFLYTIKPARELTLRLERNIFSGKTFKEKFGIDVHGRYRPITNPDLRPPQGKGADFPVQRDIEDEHYPLMVHLPRGSFQMGSDDREYERDSFESSQHRKIIHRPFALGQFPITRKQFAHFLRHRNDYRMGHIYVWSKIGWVEDRAKDWSNPGFEQADDHPVVGVSQLDALAYCKWLSEQTGKNYRLPSEAEWEYACRARSETPFSWGFEVASKDANYNGEFVYTGGGELGTFIGGTVPVRTYAPNAWKFYQMHGNVWEWCSDAWNENYHGSPTNATPWRTGDLSRAIERGGSWLSRPESIRSAKRMWDATHIRGNTVGFRVARDTG